jgi:hypothetical protein
MILKMFILKRINFGYVIAPLKLTPQKWARIMEMLWVYKSKNSGQFHYVFSEPAVHEEEEDVPPEDDINTFKNPDPGYGGSSPI